MKKLRPLKEADVTAESAFFMHRRQVLKALGIGAAPRPPANRWNSANPPHGKTRCL